MIKFHKRVPQAISRYILSRIEESLEQISEDSDISVDRLQFKISGFSPFIRYSRFAAFSEVSVDMKGENYVLDLKPSATLFLPFALAIVAYFAFRTIGPISFQGLLFIFLMPVILVIVALIDSVLRTFLWWRRL